MQTKQVYSRVNACLIIVLALWHSSVQASAPVGAEQASSQAKPAETVVIKKSPLDDKSYRALTLENGLRVLLISDPETERSAAAIDVKVGSGHDPQDRQGLAHYLEHMLFLGTKKYPKAGEYQQYISDHGGSKNAYTVVSNTNYHFSIDPDFFFSALDQFAQFFISPTFTKEYVSRERAVVHSEYMARRKDESRRLWTAKHRLSNPKHPSTNFSVGSLQTLADREGSSIRDELIKFYQTYYYAGNMALTVLGKESLDELENQISQIFADIRDVGTPGPQFEVPLVEEKTLPARLDLKPLIETRRVTFGFPIDSVRPHYKSKPLNLISSILGHEGEGSILAELKARGWAEALSAGGGYMDDVQGLMEVNIKLTPEGMLHLKEVGRYLFAMIGNIARDGIQEWRFTEEQQLAELDFRFVEEVDAYSRVRSLASLLQRYSFAEVLSGPYELESWRPDLVKSFVAQLNPQQLLLTVVDPAVSSEDKTAWYDVEYKKSGIKADWQQAWMAALAGEADASENAAVADISQLALPEQNPFVPQRLELVSNNQTAADEMAKPALLADTGNVSVWHQTKTQFKLPKANFFLSVRSPKANDSPRRALMSELMVKAINDRLNSYSYPAYQAGLHYRLYRHSRGLSVRISGYSDKQSALLDRILAELKPSTVLEKKFEQYKRELVRDLANRLKGRPSDLMVGALYDVLMTNSWSTAEQQAVISSLTMEDFRAHQHAFFKAVSVVALSVGNVTQNESKSRAEQVVAAFSASATVDVERSQLRQLSKGQALACPLPLEHPDAAFSLYLQGGAKSINDLASMQVIGALIEPRFYKQLRTENEVGYLVYATAFNVLDVPALLLSVQSNSHSVKDIAGLTADFVQSFSTSLADMSEKEYLTTREGLLSQLREAPSNLGELADRYWSELDRQAFTFDTREKLIKAVEGLSRESVQAYYANLVTSNDSRRLLALSYGRLDASLPAEEPMLFKREASLNQARAELRDVFPDALGG